LRSAGDHARHTISRECAKLWQALTQAGASHSINHLKFDTSRQDQPLLALCSGIRVAWVSWPGACSEDGVNELAWHAICRERNLLWQARRTPGQTFPSQLPSGLRIPQNHALLAQSPATCVVGVRVSCMLSGLGLATPLPCHPHSKQPQPHACCQATYSQTRAQRVTPAGPVCFSAAAAAATCPQ
jgi:hypothetical protein